MSHNVPEQFTKGYVPPFQVQPNAPGQQRPLDPEPINDITADGKPYKFASKLQGHAALITGADSGIGRAIAILFALEGANLTIHALKSEENDLQDLERLVHSKTGGKTKVHSVLLDLRDESACKQLVQEHVSAHGKLDTLGVPQGVRAEQASTKRNTWRPCSLAKANRAILNHGTQNACTDITKLSSEQWLDTFNTNIHSFFFLSKAAIPELEKSPYATITFNASINMAVGHPELLDYTATKGAIIAFMRALSNQIVGDKGIRCNAVAPGPIWTPLIPATMTKESIKTFGSSVPIGRPGQPVEVATCFVFLASADSSYISGQIIHVNGGVVIN